MFSSSSFMVSIKTHCHGQCQCWVPLPHLHYTSQELQQPHLHFSFTPKGKRSLSQL